MYSSPIENGPMYWPRCSTVEYQDPVLHVQGTILEVVPMRLKLQRLPNKDKPKQDNTNPNPYSWVNNHEKAQWI